MLAAVAMVEGMPNRRNMHGKLAYPASPFAKLRLEGYDELAAIEQASSYRTR